MATADQDPIAEARHGLLQALARAGRLPVEAAVAPPQSADSSADLARELEAQAVALEAVLAEVTAQLEALPPRLALIRRRLAELTAPGQAVPPEGHTQPSPEATARALRAAIEALERSLQGTTS